MYDENSLTSVKNIKSLIPSWSQIILYIAVGSIAVGSIGYFLMIYVQDLKFRNENGVLVSTLGINTPSVNTTTLIVSGNLITQCTNGTNGIDGVNAFALYTRFLFII